MKCDRAGYLLTTDAMSAAQALRKLARSAGLSRLTRHKYKAWLRSALQRVYVGLVLDHQ